MSPTISVGIMFQPQISFFLDGSYSFSGKSYHGEQTVSFRDGLIAFDGQLLNKITLSPLNEDDTFVLKDVVIGIHFHWERKEDQRFKGTLEFIVEEQKITAINILPIDTYLISVIASEMSATSSIELLKAHTIISRSWLLSQIEKRQAIEISDASYVTNSVTETEWIRWWDREDHQNFDVCADDHCQRYQGITRASQSLQVVTQAVMETVGEVIMYKNAICDARYSKCCGGVFEEFQYNWEPVQYPYLTKGYDGKHQDLPHPLPDLTQEAAAEVWIRSFPPAFCHTQDQAVLSQVLNSYDQETIHFFRWGVSYTTQELSDLIHRRTEIDFGTIIDLIPLERGTSGRITRLKVVGSKKTMVLGKELLIRKALSESHLYSSAFVVDKTSDGFLLLGAGWGHGVGLCQIGAAVMASSGYSYREILSHYFLGSTLKKTY
ncbi:MAG: SpoIID/LytB domain-containing protein [Prevotellaceae bacterium]|jgi:SpoIID/LytB domain protein|nr:SpoIID/LytB domain-containing protein [Prevotellaceae bacterium]